MPRNPPRVSGDLNIGPAGAPPFRKRWMELLSALRQEASISAAARAVGLSYKAAWDAVAAMNNLAGHPLVECNVGGKGGGGARLTARGRRLVETFGAVETEHRRYVDRVNRAVRDPAGLRTLGRMTLLTSARNHFVGKVSRIVRGSVNDEVELDLGQGQRIVAVVTRESTQLLGLRRGREAVALIKASWIIVMAGDSSGLRLSARNCLSGQVERLIEGAVSTEVVLRLAGGQMLVAVVTRDSGRTLKLVPGDPANAVFKASSVILGVAG